MLQLCSDSIVMNLTKSPLPVLQNFSCTRTVPSLQMQDKELRVRFATVK